MAKRLLLLSNSTMFGEPYLEHAKPHITRFLGDGVKRVLFIPYAGVTIAWDAYAAHVANAFQAMGYELDAIHRQENAIEAIASAEAIAIGGGNTFNLLKTMYDRGVIDAIRNRIEGGCPMMGWSAGSNVACPTIRTTNDMPVVEPPSFDALNVIPFQINPHFTDERLPNHGGETRSDRLNEFIESNPGVCVVGLREGSALLVEGSEVSLLGEKDMLAFVNGQETKTYKPEDSISFLMG